MKAPDISTNTATHFDTATETLLNPSNLDLPALQNVLGNIMSHKVDYADLYFQYSRAESWGLEEGQVKSGNFSIDQGVGVRAIYGDKTAFAYSDEINLDALNKAAKATRVIGPEGGKQAVAKKLFNPVSNKLYSDLNPLDSLQPKEKIALLESIERRAKARDPRVIQVMASLAGEFDVVLVVRADGLLAADIRPLVRVSVHVIAEQNGRRESGSSGGGARHDYHFFDADLINRYVDEAVDGALVNLESRPAPAGVPATRCSSRPPATRRRPRPPAVGHSEAMRWRWPGL